MSGRPEDHPDFNKKSKLWRALALIGPDGRKRSEDEYRFDRSTDVSEKLDIAVRSGWVTRLAPLFVYLRTILKLRGMEKIFTKYGLDWAHLRQVKLR